MKVTVARPSWGENYGPGWNGFITRRRDFVAAGISWFSRWDDLSGIPVCHTFIIQGIDLTIEAFTHPGVAQGTLTAYLDDPDVALLIRKPRNYTPELGQRIVAAAYNRIGEKYDFGLIAADAMANTYLGHWINRVTGGWPNRLACKLLGTDSRMICSELVATADHQPELIGSGFLTQPANTITPQMIFEDQTIFDPGAIELV